MSMQEGLALFERVAEAGGKLLRAEADRAGPQASVLVLTFDVGRLVVVPSDAGLAIVAAEGRDALPPGIDGLEEEEPWWRLLGQPLTAAWPGGVEDGVGARGLGDLMVLKMRFRAESDNPRIIAVEATGNALRVSLEG